MVMKQYLPPSRKDLITFKYQPLQEEDEFTYLGRRITTDGDYTKVHKVGKANQPFAMLKPRRSTRSSTHTILRKSKSSVPSVFLSGSQGLKATTNIEP
ncbi:hypothetical protein DPMN_101960 [Dreissena polymorpha]|uniref:Uncharacterized protein n=1 Tax=Dreissena polymorpha TaxID=45954 RepID=A0A9D4R9J3_DREPO|nr:hypothetical protein DPMN_101960 [Dreissena polymorpha]